MTHTVQFTTMQDFIADIDNRNTAAIYHQLIEQRTATGTHGLTHWQLTTVIRAIVANGLINDVSVVHIAAITIPHGPPVQRVNGRTIDPGGDPGPARWNEASQRHDAIIDHLRNWLRNRRADVHLLNVIRPGILNVPNDLPLVYAAYPPDENEAARARPQEAPAP